MKWSFKIVLLFLFLTFYFLSFGQQKITVRGVVLNNAGQPIADATIREKGTNTVKTTDNKGHYYITVADNAILVFSYLKNTQEIPVDGKHIIDVKLSDEGQQMDEVVVIGYGQQSKKKLLGSVSTIDAQKLESRAVTNASSALSGLAAGVQVKVGDGRPGYDGATIRVRGTGSINNNNALVIIDGIQGQLDAVNPEDIETISILKDASSAAIYGARAANGVILITTKKGALNQKPQINYTGIFSRLTPAIKPEFVQDYVSLMKLVNEASENIGAQGPYSQTAIDKWTEANKDPNGLAPSGLPNYVAYPNTNWGDWIYDNGWLQNHNLSALGGSEAIRYNLSGRIQNNPGIMKNTGLKRYEGRINLEARINEFLTVGTQTFVLNENRDKASDTDLYNYLRQTTPGIYPYYDGKFGGAVEGSGESTQLNNLLLYLYDNQGKNERTRLNTTLFAKFNLYKGLTFETKFNYQNRVDEVTNFKSPNAKYDFSTLRAVSIPSTPSQLNTEQGSAKLYRKSFDNVLRYETSYDKHNLSVLLGHNEFYYNTYYFQATKKGLIDESISNIGTGNELIAIDGDETDNAMRSFFGRISYDYASTYLMEFSLRRDGSSKFGKDKKYGSFPSISLGYLISNESFMRNVEPYFQDIKIRGSWGRLGNDGGDEQNVYAWHGVFDKVNYSFNGGPVSGLQLSRFGNNLFHWEVSENKELGLEFSTIKRKASVEVNYYNRLTTDIIRVAQIPLTAGTTSAPYSNQASMRNSGIEVSINWKDAIGDFHYSIGGNFAYNKNKVVKFDGPLKQGYVNDGSGNKIWQSNLGEVSSGGLNRVLEGYGYNEFYLRQVYRGDESYFNSDGSVNIKGGPSTGMIRTEKDYEWAKAMKTAGYSFLTTTQQIADSYGSTRMYYGDLIYADLNGDGIYGNAADQYFTGTRTSPKYIYGFNLGFSYKGFDMSMIWAGEAGVQYYWRNDGYNSNIVSLGNQITTRIANDHYFFDPSNPTDPRTNQNGYLPRLKGGASAENINNQSSDFWLYNANFLKLRNLQVGYTFNAKILERIKINKLRVFFTGENLLLFTSFPGLDPEVGATAKYPTMKQFAFGLNFGF